MASKEEWQYLGPRVSGRLPWSLRGSQASKSVNSFPGSWMATEPPWGFPWWGEEEEEEEGSRKEHTLVVGWAVESSRPPPWFISLSDRCREGEQGWVVGVKNYPWLLVLTIAPKSEVLFPTPQSVKG